MARQRRWRGRDRGGEAVMEVDLVVAVERLEIE
jgi:hypothetical protein